MRRPRIQRERGRAATALTLSLALSAGLVAFAQAPASAEDGDVEYVADPTAYVDPMIGTGNGGESVGEVNNFPGVAAPFGMMQLSPDTPNAPGGYHYDANTIKGFSLNHASVGCPAFGDIPILPVTGAIASGQVPNADRLSNRTVGFSHDDEHAELGSYSLGLANGVDVDLTATTRTGLLEFEFPADQLASIVVKSGSSIGGSRANTHVEVVGDSEVAGYSTTGGFCAVNDNEYTVYFDIVFDRPFQSHGTYVDRVNTADALSADGPNSGAYLGFDVAEDQTVTAKVSMSYVSIDGARRNMAAEIPGWDLAPVAADTREQWRQLLSKVAVGGGEDEHLTQFYTALYHSFLHPNTFNDVDGQYIGFDDVVRTLEPGQTQYANFSDWDIYRSLVQLQALLLPDETAQMGESLLRDAQQQGGWWPRWPLANDTTSQMNGDNSVPVYVNYAVWGADTSKMDLAAALEIMEKGATQSAPVGWGWYERRGVEDYVELGYQPNNADSAGDHGLQGASQTLEWAIDDYTIAQLAGLLGDDETREEYLQRSQNWQNIFNPTTGYLSPRDDFGAFPAGPGYVPPTGNNFGQSGYAEGNAAQYNWLVPQNLKGLIDSMGGAEPTIERLDAFFEQINAGPNVPFMWAGNEINFGVPWVYNALGQPWKTQEQVRRIQTELFANGPGGAPGNDDLGAQSSWYVWASLGLYPITPGETDLGVHAPLFEHAKLSLGNGNTIRINAEGAGVDAAYVTDLRLDGQEYEHTALPQSFAVQGGTLDFTLSNEPDETWAASPEAASPSYTEYQRPAIGLTDPTGPVTVTAGDSLDLEIGAAGTGLGETPVTWKAVAPDGVTVTPSSGSLTVPSIGQVRDDVVVDVSESVESGSHPVSFEFETADGQKLPGGTVVLAVLAADGNAIMCSVLSTEVTGTSLTWKDEGDGKTVPAERGGFIGRTTTGTSNYMYFQVDDLYAAPGNGARAATVNVTYFDQGTGSWNLHYDSAGTTGNPNYKDSPRWTNTNTNTWKTATFVLPDAEFSNGENGNSDFRLNIGIGQQVIGRVSVTVNGPGVTAMHLCDALPQAPEIATGPADAVVLAGGDAEFGAAVSSDLATRLAWQSKAPGSDEWVAVDGQTGPTLALAGVGTSVDGTQYRVVASNLAGQATSDPATLRVYGPVSAAVGAGEIAEFGTIDFTGAGFLPGEDVTATLEPGGFALGTATADASGAVSGSATLADDVVAGRTR
ncbi:GH92 family glycosyl hydrolase [Agromyces protaetiae]|nr:GH92 family glycosyl hydrolase [Agromyces protaetiae]